MAKVSITPQTVPSNPRNGAPLTAMARRIKPDSSLSDSRATALSRVRLMCSMLLRLMPGLRAPPASLLSRASNSRQPS